MRKVNKITTVILIFFPLLLMANFGGEDHSPFRSVGNFQALHTTKVSLLKERLNIYFYSTFAKIEVTYTFYNSSDEPIKIKAGFPVVVFTQMSHSTILEEPFLYRILVDGKPVDFALQNGGSYSDFEISDDYTGDSIYPSVFWYVSEIPFETNQTREVKISVDVDYLWRIVYGASGSDPMYYTDGLYYIISSASVWKDGTIQDLEVNVYTEKKVKVILDKKFSWREKNNKDLPDYLEPFSYIYAQQNVKAEEIGNLYFEVIPERVAFVQELTTMKNFFYYASRDSRNILTKEVKSLSLTEQQYRKALEEMISLIGENNLERIKEVNFWADNKGIYLEHSFYSVRASSTLKSATQNYAPINVADGKADTAWVEGKEGEGIGEWLELTLFQPSVLDSITILPGYYKSKSLYYANSRPRMLRINVDDKKNIDLFVPDFYNILKIPLVVPLGGKEKIKRIRISILDTYPGSRYSDTCISEVRVRQRFSRAFSEGVR